MDPQSGVRVYFVNKRLSRLKVLWWNRNGYCILYKRMHRAVLAIPSDGSGSPALKIGTRSASRR
ncbi:IS66 family insertion sequence element accessory protein TnpB [Paraliomyxa miuraensis]|uniref:IS66 family insertion sequence element accessory protein TnpB n=1 Tax=Paraliomyxa miuraensis TaxID=376150 RepID=UPI0022585328|nr:IS66 family insertion sequence element accessory protein TnpB [Paraliomyxa miuraensis]MCX4241085.1 IS66 family insertion sequence element accessory protein TnpB [Paraliomyxa miuraensis]